MRLIDADKLTPSGYFIVDGNDPKKSIDELIGRIQTAPTVDAVEVVRCKDCRYWEKEYGGRYISACTFGYCNECKMHTIDNYFCAYGGRKDNGNV